MAEAYGHIDTILEQVEFLRDLGDNFHAVGNAKVANNLNDVAAIIAQAVDDIRGLIEQTSTDRVRKAQALSGSLLRASMKGCIGNNPGVA